MLQLLLCLILALVVWCVGSNLDFYRGKPEYENLYAQCSAYLALAEAAEGCTPGMPVYPHEGCARVIDGAAVVKLSAQ